VVRAVVRKLGTELARRLVDPPEAGVVARVLVFRPGIAEGRRSIESSADYPGSSLHASEQIFQPRRVRTNCSALLPAPANGRSSSGAALRVAQPALRDRARDLGARCRLAFLEVTQAAR
jgi:hypothetical protein